MYCSTCGAYVPAGRSACSECGTQVALPARRRPSPTPRFGSEDRRWIAEPQLGVCPRCGYRGEGITYFSSGRHVALLVGATVLTAGMMGIGGIAYYLVRRDHRSCPRCGKSWGRYGELGVRGERGGALVPGQPAYADALLRGDGGRRKQVVSVVLFALAVILMIGGIASFEIAPILLGLAAAGGGWFARRAALEAREARRAALLGALQQPVLELASQRGGRLTVTEVAARLGWSVPRAEKVLESLNDGLRVDSEVTDEGVIVYEFRELRGLARPARGSAGSPALDAPQEGSPPPRPEGENTRELPPRGDLP